MRRAKLCRSLAGAVAGIVLLHNIAIPPAYAVALEWTRQLGTTARDYSNSISADSFGNIYISGFTEGSLNGPNAGANDAFLSKYDASGNVQWTRQLGTTLSDESRGVAVDGLGNAYITGTTNGSLDGPNVGNADVIVAKYDAAGSRLWTRQFGSVGSDRGDAIAADGLGSVYIAGYTDARLSGDPHFGQGDAFVSKFDASGDHVWTQQLGTSESDVVYGVSADGLGNVYISGSTEGSLGGAQIGSTDAFVAKYDAAGYHQWTRQLGTITQDYSTGVAADGLGNIYISGQTNGIFGDQAGAGLSDAFVAKYDAAGSRLWTRQFGTAGEDLSTSITIDGLGNIYISGYTNGNLAGDNAGSADAFVRRYDPLGNVAWTQQVGSAGGEESKGVAADGLGNVYISGWTDGNLGGPNAGVQDAFVTKFLDFPGDYNRDGVVDAADYVVWRDQLGQVVQACSGGDANCNGFVEAGDYGPWKENYGRTLSAGAAVFGNVLGDPAASVPEPSSLTLLGVVIAVMGHLSIGRRRGPDEVIHGRVRKTLVDDESELAVVVRVLEDRSCGIGLRELARTLQAEGVPCRGKRWHHSTIRQIERRYDPALM
jgi:hypothetical protein